MVLRSGTSISLIWPKPYSACDIDRYELQYRLVGTTEWTIAACNIQSQSYKVQNLWPANAYMFRVRPHYASVPEGASDWEDLANCAISPIYHTEGTTPDAPVEVDMLKRTQTMMQVTWKMPRYNGRVVLNYELQRQTMLEISKAKSHVGVLASAIEDKSAPWITVSNAIEVEFHTIDVLDLMHGTPYRFRLRARNALGWGEYGVPTGPFWTHGMSYNCKVKFH